MSHINIKNVILWLQFKRKKISKNYCYYNLKNWQKDKCLRFFFLHWIFFVSSLVSVDLSWKQNLFDVTTLCGCCQEIFSQLLCWIRGDLWGELEGFELVIRVLRVKSFRFSVLWRVFWPEMGEDDLLSVLEWAHWPPINV